MFSRDLLEFYCRAYIVYNIMLLPQGLMTDRELNNILCLSLTLTTYLGVRVKVESCCSLERCFASCFAFRLMIFFSLELNCLFELIAAISFATISAAF